jgi:hypothetical protein
MNPKTKTKLKENFRFMAKGTNGINTPKFKKFFDALEKFNDRLSMTFSDLFAPFDRPEDDEVLMVEVVEAHSQARGFSVIGN